MIFNIDKIDYMIVNLFKGIDVEQWRPVKNFPDYMISNLGKVKSLKFGKEKILKPRKRKDGRLDVVLCNESGKKRFLVHRLVGMVFLGISDDQEVDHIDGNPFNNRLENLRVCTHAENGRNRKKQINNSTGYPGVSFHKRSGKYQARIMINGKHKHLGLFETTEEAFAAYKNASLKLHGAFSPFISRKEFKALEARNSTVVTQDEFKTLEGRVSALEQFLNLKRNNISEEAI